jgi:hypothetical protein
MIAFDLKNKKKISTNNLTDIYAVMQSFESLQPQDFNLEGVIYTGRLVFIQSGNGSSGKTSFYPSCTNSIKSLA